MNINHKIMLQKFITNFIFFIDVEYKIEKKDKLLQDKCSLKIFIDKMIKN